MFWDNYEKLCNKIGKTPTGVCLELGYSNATATHWRHGRRPSGKALQKIADYFGMNVDELLWRETIPANPDEIVPGADNIFPITRKKWRSFKSGVRNMRKKSD